MTKLDERLRSAWIAVVRIKDEPDFDALYEDIESGVLADMVGDDRNTAIEALNAYLVQLGKADSQGFV